MSIVSTQWLSKNYSNVKIIDSSWHMPTTDRNGFEEYKKEHIENAIFFDIEKFSNKKTENHKKLPSKTYMEKIVSK